MIVETNCDNIFVQSYSLTAPLFYWRNVLYHTWDVSNNDILYVIVSKTARIISISYRYNMTIKYNSLQYVLYTWAYRVVSKNMVNATFKCENRDPESKWPSTTWTGTDPFGGAQILVAKVNVHI